MNELERRVREFLSVCVPYPFDRTRVGEMDHPGYCGGFLFGMDENNPHRTYCLYIIYPPKEWVNVSEMEIKVKARLFGLICIRYTVYEHEKYIELDMDFVLGGDYEE